MSYEPKIEVVRQTPYNPRIWTDYDHDECGRESALLVRGVPMPGERVMDRDGTVHTVRDLEVKWVEVYDESRRLMKVLRLKVLRPYDPEAERLRVATEVLKRTEGLVPKYEDIARAVDEAYRKGGFLKEVDDG